jgi:membrane fusion protein (multidrug efflux system)
MFFSTKLPYFFVAFSGLVLMSSCKKSETKATNTPAQNPAAMPVNVFVAVNKDLTDNVISSGTLLAAEQLEIHPEISGRITMLNIQEGRQISKGTLLVKLYDGDLQAQLQKLYAQKENDEKNEQRAKQLLARDAASQQDYDLVSTQLKTTLADIELVKAQILKTEIRAPFSGVIGLRNVSPGAYVSPSTTIANLQQTDPLKVDFFVPEKYSSRLSVNKSVVFEVDGFTEKFKGNIYAIEPGIDQATRSIKIRAMVANTGAKLHPGAFAKVRLDIQDIKAVMVPTQAIIPQTRGKQVVLLKNGKAAFRKVETGLRNENQVQVTSGLAEGDTVITTGLMFVKPDAPLKVGKVVNE